MNLFVQSYDKVADQCENVEPLKNKSIFSFLQYFTQFSQVFFFFYVDYVEQFTLYESDTSGY